MDGRAARGARSREHIMKEAVELASVEGLGGLSLGVLASRASLSKSGIATLFGSKEQLQLATVAAAREVFRMRVAEPALQTDAGINRIRRLLDAWLAYSRERAFAGGCFFVAASAEFDSKVGPVRDSIVAAVDEWHSYLSREIGRAVELGQLPQVDVGQYVFETTAFLETANARSLLSGSPAPYESAKRALARLYGEW
jgi:AcrR family transcriptional regulator